MAPARLRSLLPIVGALVALTVHATFAQAAEPESRFTSISWLSIDAPGSCGGDAELLQRLAQPAAPSGAEPAAAAQEKLEGNGNLMATVKVTVKPSPSGYLVLLDTLRCGRSFQDVAEVTTCEEALQWTVFTIRLIREEGQAHHEPTRPAGLCADDEHPTSAEPRTRSSQTRAPAKRTRPPSRTATVAGGDTRLDFLAGVGANVTGGSPAALGLGTTAWLGVTLGPIRWALIGTWWSPTAETLGGGPAPAELVWHRRSLGLGGCLALPIRAGGALSLGGCAHADVHFLEVESAAAAATAARRSQWATVGLGALAQLRLGSGWGVELEPTLAVAPVDPEIDAGPALRAHDPLTLEAMIALRLMWSGSLAASSAAGASPGAVGTAPPYTHPL
jgi:hypothetical protein